MMLFLSSRRALAAVAPRRRLCLSPGADSAAAPALAWMPYRLVRVSGPPGPVASATSSLIELVPQSMAATRGIGRLLKVDGTDLRSRS